MNKYLYITYSHPFGKWGGVSKFDSEIINRISKVGKVTVLYFVDRQDSKKWKSEGNISIIKVKNSNFRSKLRKIDFNKTIISNGGKSVWYRSSIEYIKSKSEVTYFDHGDNIKRIIMKNVTGKRDEFSRFRKDYYRGKHTVLQDIDKIFTFSEEDKNLWIKHGFDKNKIDFYSPALIEPKHQIKIVKNEYDVAFIGRTVAQKKISDFFKLDNGSNKLVICGAPSLKKDKIAFNHLIKKSKKVFWYGHTTEEHVEKILMKTAWLFLPSNWEGRPISISNALSVGTKVIVYDNYPSVKMLSRNKGLYVAKNIRDVKRIMKEMGHEFTRHEIINSYEEQYKVDKIRNQKMIKHLLNETNISETFSFDLKTKLITDFNKINKDLNSKGIDLIAHSGTLLGAGRDSKFIPWDYDVDMYIKYGDLIQKWNVIQNVADSNGYELINYFSKRSVNGNKTIKLVKKNVEYSEKWRGFNIKNRLFIDIMILFPLHLDNARYIQNREECKQSSKELEPFKRYRTGIRFIERPMKLNWLSYTITGTRLVHYFDKIKLKKRFMAEHKYMDLNESKLRRRDLWSYREFVTDLDNMVELEFEDQKITVNGNWKQELNETFGVEWEIENEVNRRKVENPRWVSPNKFSSFGNIYRIKRNGEVKFVKSLNNEKWNRKYWDKVRKWHEE